MYYIAERVEKLKDRGCKAWDTEVGRSVDTESELRDRIRELEEENRKLKEKSEEKSDFNPSELEGAKVQWKYYEDLAESRRVLMEKIIHETYEIVKKKL